MTDKEKNFAILSKLYEFADEIWENVEDKRAGVFTASEIARSIKSCKDVIVCFGDLGDEQITVEVDSFKCSIPKSRIFEYMSDFQIQGTMFSKLCKRLGARKTYIAECTNYGGSSCIENCVFSCGGLSITTKYSGRYPNVKGVIRDVREVGRMILCPDAWKDATKFFKSSKGQTVKITANVGDDFAVLSNEDGSECVIKTLQNPAQNVESTHKADSLRLFGNVCEIFFNGQNCPLTFISGDASMGLVMPCCSEQYYELGESERHNPIELAKAAHIDKKAAKVISCRPAKENARKTPPTASCGKDMASAARRVRAKVLRRRAPTFVAGRVRPPPYYAHNEGRMNSFRFYNNFKISKE